MKSLYSTFVTFTLFVMFISSLFAFFLANTYYQRFLKPENDAKYTNIALEIADYVEEGEQLVLVDYLEHIASIGYQIHLVSASGETMFFGQPFRNVTIDPTHVDRVLSGHIFHGIVQFKKKTFVTGFFANELENSIGVPLRYKGETFALFLRPDIKLHFNEMRILFAWLLGLTILFSLIFEIILAKYLIQPLSALNKATKKIRDGNFRAPVHIKRKDEIGELARSFQEMSQQLAKLDQMRNEFIANVTHDFQSPLANMKGYTEMLASPNLSKIEQAEYTKIIRDEATRLSNLTSQLLLLSSLNQFSPSKLQRTVFSISEQIKSLVKKYQFQLFEKDISLQYSLSGTMVSGHADFLFSVWDNLLSNAIKYNKHGGSIVITMNDHDEEVEVKLTDTGIGVTEEQRRKLFERFYRADASRTKEISGTGLGLAIVLQIVQLHEGKLKIESEKGKGTSVIVTLPKKM